MSEYIYISQTDGMSPMYTENGNHKINFSNMNILKAFFIQNSVQTLLHTCQILVTKNK